MAEAARWGQLTYSSFDTGAGSGGGWQVKEISGDLTAEEIEVLRSRVVTNFDAAVELPQFPTPEEISELPRRLIYHPISPNRAAYWHAIPSGLDGTGRPGNVFSHSLLDRDTVAPDSTLRPIDTWRAQWLTPFGQPQVLAANLDPDPIPTSGTAVSRQSIVDFILDTAVWRWGVLVVLLDAVLIATRGGKKVVLIVDDSDAAAMWIGSVSHLMAPATARGLGFSVFERVGGVDLAADRGALLIAVPAADKDAALKLENYVVISADESPLSGDLDGEPHRLLSGATVEVTPWSGMAQVALQEPESALAVLSKIDEISLRLAGSALAPEWPLAMVVALLGGDLTDANDEASRVLHESTPAGLAGIPEYWTAASALIGGLLGTSTADVWGRVATVPPGAAPTVVDGFTVSVYVERALLDREWMTQPGQVPLRGLPSAEEVGGDHLRTVANDAIARLAAPTLSDPRTVALETARLADFLVRAGLTPSSALVEQTPSPLEILVERTLVPVLVSDADGSFVAAVGPVSTRFVTSWLLPLLEVDSSFQSRPLGARLPPAVIDWLVADRFAEVVAITAGPLSPLAVELAGRACATGIDVARHSRAQVVLALLERDEFHTSAAAFASLFRPDWPWTPADILAVETAFPHSLPSSTIEATLLVAPESAELGELVSLIRVGIGSGLWSQGIEQSSILRGYCEAINGATLPSSNTTVHAAIAVKWLVTVHGTTATIPGGDVGTVLAVLLRFIDGGPSLVMPFELASYLAATARRIPSPATLAPILDAVASSGSIAPLQAAYLAELVVRGHRESPVPFESLTQRTLATLATEGASPEQRIVSLLLEAVIAAESPAPVDELAEAVMVSVRANAQPDDFDRQTDRLTNEFERFAKPLFKRLRALEKEALARTPQSKTKARPNLAGVFGSNAQQPTEES